MTDLSANWITILEFKFPDQKRKQKQKQSNRWE